MSSFEYYSIQGRQLIYDLHAWIEVNQMAAVALAIAVPVLLFSLRSIYVARLRADQLEYETKHSLANSRLPPETLERNKREETRYRREAREKQKTNPVKARSSGPRFK